MRTQSSARREEALVERLLSGDRRALARLISLVEDDGMEARRIMASLYPHTGQAHVVGVTGPPGTGKSTLVNELAKAYRRGQGRAPQTVGIVAVDPTSPFSGGAILGDRIRMRDLAGDPGIFIRSMATRGSLGGLARATADVVRVLDAAGFQVIFVETVGAGQAEVDIARTAHTVIVVEAPGLGDDIQAIKAGILEIADILVVNKADREGAEATALTLESTLNLNASRREGRAQWRPPVLKTVAISGEGVPALVDAIEAHREYLNSSGAFYDRERERVRRELQALLAQELTGRLLREVGEEQVESLVERIMHRELDLYSAVDKLSSWLEVRPPD